MINFFHLADTHFGVENYGKVDVQTGMHSRLIDFDTSFDFCVSKAINKNIDFLIFCGDAYKTANPTPTQQRLFVKQMLRLHAAKIPVVIIVGNHDHPLSFGKAHSLDVFSYLPVEGFYVFSKPDILKLQTQRGIVQIVGIPWPNRSNLITDDFYRFKNNSEITTYLSEKVGQIIYGLAQQLDPSLPSILAAHLTVSTGVFSGSEKCAIFGNDPVFLPSQLAINPFNYVALGHLHKHQNLNNGEVPIVYSGSIERIDFGERKEAKGFCDVKITKTHKNKFECHYDFIQLPIRTMNQIEINLIGGKDLTSQIIEEIEKYDLTQSIVKIIYNLPIGTDDKVDLLAISRACGKAHHIACITPVFQNSIREKRINVSGEMDFDQLLNTYFESKNINAQRRAELLKKVQNLQNKLQTKNETDI